MTHSRRPTFCELHLWVSKHSVQPNVHSLWSQDDVDVNQRGHISLGPMLPPSNIPFRLPAIRITSRCTSKAADARAEPPGPAPPKLSGQKMEQVRRRNWFFLTLILSQKIKTKTVVTSHLVGTATVSGKHTTTAPRVQRAPAGCQSTSLLSWVAFTQEMPKHNQADCSLLSNTHHVTPR